MVRKSKKSGSIIEDIKNQIKKSGANKGKFIYFKSGNKVRIRFVQDMEDGFKVLFHDSYKRGINVPCQELFSRECPYCDDKDLRHRDLYCWTVYDYDAKEAKILMGAGNSFSPVPALVGMYEAYGTLIDRDYIITKQGQQTNTTFSVAPMDKVKFKNTKVKPISEEKFLKLLEKAFPADEEVEDEEYEENEVESEGDEEAVSNYDDLSAKELYRLCVARKIKVKPKMAKEHYIELLEEADYEPQQEEEDEEDDW